jgi:hypothetical protein
LIGATEHRLVARIALAARARIVIAVIGRIVVVVVVIIVARHGQSNEQGTG